MDLHQQIKQKLLSNSEAVRRHALEIFESAIDQQITPSIHHSGSSKATIGVTTWNYVISYLINEVISQPTDDNKKIKQSINETTEESIDQTNTHTSLDHSVDSWLDGPDYDPQDLINQLWYKWRILIERAIDQSKTHSIALPNSETMLILLYGHWAKRQSLNPSNEEQDQSINQTSNQTIKPSGLSYVNSIKQSIGQSINQSYKPPLSPDDVIDLFERINDSNDQSNKRSVNQSNNQIISKQLYGLMINQFIFESNYQSAIRLLSDQSINRTISSTFLGTQSLMVGLIDEDPSIDQSINQTIDQPNRIALRNAMDDLILTTWDRWIINQSNNQSNKQHHKLALIGWLQCLVRTLQRRTQSDNQSNSQPINQSINQSIERTIQLVDRICLADSSNSDSDISSLDPRLIDVIEHCNEILIEQSNNQSNTPTINQYINQSICSCELMNESRNKLNRLLKRHKIPSTMC